MKRKELNQLFHDMSYSSSKSRRLDGNLIGAMNGDPSSAFQLFDQSPPQDRPLKRKELEEAFDDMSSNFSKSRRLDGDFFSTMVEGGGGGMVPRVLQEQVLACSSDMQGALPEDNEKALVLYNPATTFYTTPASKDFSIIVNSDLVPGLRDRIFTDRTSKWAKSLEAEQSNREDPNGCMAIVPWVESNWPPSPRKETQEVTEEVEMMDTDDVSFDSSRPNEFGVTDGSFELQRWQQQRQQQQQLHCMQPQLLNSISTPITW